MNRQQILKAVSVALLLCGVARAGTIITLDAPGAGTTAGQGTQSIGINQEGAVTGFYADSNNVVHGFVRDPNGNGAFTTFEAPGAGDQNVAGFQCTEDGCWGQGTYAIAINLQGAVTGFYADSNNVFHGFLRTSAGKFTTFDTPSAGTSSGQGTWAVGISATGVIAGYYEDSSSTFHGFLRAPDGTITPFDAPGAATGDGEGTILGWNACINATGAISGEYQDSNGVWHSFVRIADGTVTEFEAPGAGTASGQGTQAYAINAEGAVAGAYYDANFVAHGYVRAPGGTITEFDVGTGVQGTGASDVNPTGVVAGWYTDENGASHGFLRAPDGAITTFDAPGGNSGLGTSPVTINPAGAITGVYSNAGYGVGVAHGFLRTP